MAKLHTDALAGGGVEILSALVAGAAADTDIAVTGLSWKKDPRFIAAIRLEGSGTYAAPANLLAEIKRGSDDDDVQVETANTTGDHVLLVWAQRA